MKVRYFAWMKRTVGVAEEEIDAARRGRAPSATWWPGCATEAAAMPRRWPRAQPSAPPSTSAPRPSMPASPARSEVAFFPPFTGG